MNTNSMWDRWDKLYKVTAARMETLQNNTVFSYCEVEIDEVCIRKVWSADGTGVTFFASSRSRRTRSSTDGSDVVA